MSTRTKWLYSLVLALGAALLLASCASTLRLPEPTRADTVITTAGLPSVGKLVVRGNLTIQQGNGNTVADNRKAGQKQGSAATAPAAHSDNTSKKTGGPAWYIYLGVALIGALGWEYLSHKLTPLSWLPWRPKAS